MRASFHFIAHVLSVFVYFSKAQASVLAVAERQSFETLSRDEKTAARALAQAKDRQEQLNAQKAKLADDKEVAARRRNEVSMTVYLANGRLLTFESLVTACY